MKQCGHALLPRIEYVGTAGSGQHWFLPSLGQPGEAMFFVGFHLFGTSAAVELPEAILKRLFCHALLQHVPDEGLDEAVQSLFDMNEFYRLPRHVPPPLLPRKSMPARMGEAIIAPVYPVTED
jgi:hypothetical protein